MGATNPYPLQAFIYGRSPTHTLYIIRSMITVALYIPVSGSAPYAYHTRIGVDGNPEYRTRGAKIYETLTFRTPLQLPSSGQATPVEKRFSKISPVDYYEHNPTTDTNHGFQFFNGCRQSYLCRSTAVVVLWPVSRALTVCW